MNEPRLFDESAQLAEFFRDASAAQTATATFRRTKPC